MRSTGPLPAAGTGAHEVGNASLVIRPNRSLSVAGVAALFGALSTLALAIGIGFTLAGAWMVLPFVGIEIVTVAALCLWFYRHVDDCELVVIDPDSVTITKRHGTKLSSHEFPRHWVRVIHGSDADNQDPRLLIGSHGRYIRVADHISESDRARVARELKRLLRMPSWRDRGDLLD